MNPVNRSAFIQEIVHAGYSYSDCQEKGILKLLETYTAPPVQELIFQQAFDNASEEQLQAIENAAGVNPYPLWKKTLFIDTPRALASSLEDIAAIGAACIGYASYFLGKEIVAITGFYVEKASPFFINNTPVSILRIFNTTLDFLNTVRSYFGLRTICVVYIADWALKSRISQIPYLGTIWKVTVTSFKVFVCMFPESMVSFILCNSYDIWKFSYEELKHIPPFLRDTAEKATMAKTRLLKQATYPLWMELSQAELQ